ncbi:MAG: hypothetical protein IPK78_17615 [Rhodospirillales bacterium]|nr:hypothetical protein [Rhodospirillales bacterium]
MPTRATTCGSPGCSGDTDEERNFSRCFWTALRTITAGDPVPVPGITLIAVRIRATGQLQGTIDEFNVTARTIARDWDASINSWIWRPTSQPAALFRHILQHPSRRKPATDAQIDLDRLTYWDGVTRPARREFNGVFDAKTSLYDALARTARLGRAMVSLRDLKFSVVIDEPRSVPVRMFTPRNSWNYEGEMTHEPVPHGYRIAFVNEEASWKTEEVVVYDDGYSAANATLIDRVEIVGSPAATRRGRRAAIIWRSSACAGRSIASTATSSSSPASAATWWPCSTTSSPQDSPRRASPRSPRTPPAISPTSPSMRR